MELLRIIVIHNFEIAFVHAFNKVWLIFLKYQKALISVGIR